MSELSKLDKLRNLFKEETKQKLTIPLTQSEIRMTTQINPLYNKWLEDKVLQANEANEQHKQCTIPDVMPSADLKFILWHRETKTEIEMPVLSICEEYSRIAFGTKEGAYNDDYNGIGRLPSYTGNDTAEEYDVFVEINGVRYLYDGLFYNSDYTETKRKH